MRIFTNVCTALNGDDVSPDISLDSTLYNKSTLPSSTLSLVCSSVFNNSTKPSSYIISGVDQEPTSIINSFPTELYVTYKKTVRGDYTLLVANIGDPAAIRTVVFNFATPPNYGVARGYYDQAANSISPNFKVGFQVSLVTPLETRETDSGRVWTTQEGPGYFRFSGTVGMWGTQNTEDIVGRINQNIVTREVGVAMDEDDFAQHSYNAVCTSKEFTYNLESSLYHEFPLEFAELT